jgi:hypothetical protein
VGYFSCNRLSVSQPSLVLYGFVGSEARIILPERFVPKLFSKIDRLELVFSYTAPYSSSMVIESPETVYVGYSAEELAARAQAEYQANAALKTLAARWQARAAAERDAMRAVKALAAKWRQAAAIALQHEPFPLVRVKLKSKVSPLARRRVRPMFMSQAAFLA